MNTSNNNKIVRYLCAMDIHVHYLHRVYLRYQTIPHFIPLDNEAEELTLSMEGNQNLDEEEEKPNQNLDVKEQPNSSPSAQSPPAISHHEDQLEDTGITGTIVEEEPQEEVVVTCTIIVYMMALLLHNYQNIVKADERKGPHELNQFVESPEDNDSTDQPQSTEQVNEPLPTPNPPPPPNPPSPPIPSFEYASNPIPASIPITAGNGVKRVVNDSDTLHRPTSTQPQTVKGFETNGPEISTTPNTTATAPTVADSFSVPASTADSEFSNGEWVMKNNTPLPVLPSNEAWVVPLPDNIPTHPNPTPSDPPDCEATSWEEKPVEVTKPEPIKDQGGGGGASCLLVLPPINWKALEEIKDGESEIVVPPEKPFEPPEDSSDHSSDAN